MNRIRSQPSRWLIALCLSAAPLLISAAGWDLEQLMQALAQAKPGTVKFIETKTLAILERPLQSSGELRYTPPDRLEKRTLKPVAETLIVQGDNVTVERHGRSRSLRLSDYPDIASLVDSIRGTLAGDRALLERVYNIKLSGERGNWQLDLQPRSVGQAAIHLVRIVGSGAQVRSIDVIQTDGDHALTTIVMPQ